MKVSSPKAYVGKTQKIEMCNYLLFFPEPFSLGLFPLIAHTKLVYVLQETFGRLATVLHTLILFRLTIQVDTFECAVEFERRRQGH